MATLRAGPHTKTGQITLYLDSPAISLPDKSFAFPSKEIPGFSATAPVTSNTGMITVTVTGNASGISFEDVTIIPNTGKRYVFDLGQNQRQEVAVEGRTFVVRLIEFKQLDVPGVPAPVEYVFGISDK